MASPPLKDAYWVVEGLLLAGRHPGPYDEDAARERLATLLDAGIEVFVDLTHPDEVASYEPLLREEATARGVSVEYLRAPIRDRGIPSKEDVTRLLSAIDSALAAECPVYVHCWGGIGRTGTIVGCWLAQNGHADAALERLAHLRTRCAGGSWPSPETDAQREVVRAWRAGE
jgi:protein-tyrosine phosphatase